MGEFIHLDSREPRRSEDFDRLLPTPHRAEPRAPAQLRLYRDFVELLFATD